MLEMMWGASDDGDPVDGEFVDEPVWTCDYGWIKSSVNAHGVLFLDYPETFSSGERNLSYNWWSGFTDTPEWDFGPRHRADYRSFRTGGTGWPWGDPNRYHVMSNSEIDYDILYTASIPYDDPVWLTPPWDVAQMASTYGFATAPPNLLSIGPYDIPPGASISVPFAFIGGRNFHTDPNNKENNLPYYPDGFYENLDFTDLIKNATWAKWIYDNPGVDTDGNGSRGEYTICDGDTVFYTGDGIPDWRGATPPLAPYFWLEPLVNGLRIRFNGTRSETSRDIFSGATDFEGYRIYMGLDERPASMNVIASYDRENYDKYVWTGTEDFQYALTEPPFTPDSLRCLYGAGDYPCTDGEFHPLQYTRSAPYILEGYVDSLFFFTVHDHNTSEFGLTTPIRKVYPDEPYPASFDLDSVPPEALTAEGNLKYFEYEFTVDNLLPTIPYWINVTAFDAGAAAMRLGGLETAVSVGTKSAYPLGPSQVDAQNKEVYVWPNPYCKDADYRDLGFEGRMEEDRPDHRVRAVHFGNLPPRCTIYIYSLDGDLVRKLEHNMDPADINSSYDSWNLITRNTEMVVSGLYYWVVESPDGTTQMGKLVIIM